MTTKELLAFISTYPLYQLALYVGVPLLTLVCGWLHGRGHGGDAPWRYIYAVLAYLTCVPGLFATVLVVYVFFFTRRDLLDFDPLLLFGPIVSMAVTLLILHHRVSFQRIPGFDRLTAAMLLIGVSLAAALAIQHTYIGILFFASFYHLLFVAAVIYILLRVAFRGVFRGEVESNT